MVQAVGDRHDDLLVTPVAHHPAVPGAEGSVLGADRGQGDLNQSDAQPAVALASRARLVGRRGDLAIDAYPM
jgi:hypothetical protein